MYSHLFCGTLEVQDADLIKEDNQGIKLYKIELLEYQELVSDLISMLSSSERDRANRYHFTKDKHRFVICRALLKFILAEHMDLEIDKIIIDIDANKKPYLAAYPSVFFNISHAGDYALIAIAKSPVGVDIEYMNKSFDYEEILPHVFSKTEIDKTNNRHFTFYKFWTRKEAIVKAIGKGINDDLPKIPVTDGFHSVPLSLVGDFKKITVLSFNLDDNYIGALAFLEDIPTIEDIGFYPVPTSNELKYSIFK